MLASAGMLIPEGAISWEFQAEDNTEKRVPRGFANGRRKILTLIHRRVGLERRRRERRREMGGERERGVWDAYSEQ